MGRAWRSSSRASTRSPEAGLAISSTAITRPFRIWIPGSGCVCAAFCVSVRSGAVGAEGAIISAGPMLSLPRRGCSLLHKPRRRCVNPLGGEPPTGEPDAGEPPVRFGGREERIQSPLPTPIEKRVFLQPVKKESTKNSSLNLSIKRIERLQIEVICAVPFVLDIAHD